MKTTSKKLIGLASALFFLGLKSLSGQNVYDTYNPSPNSITNTFITNQNPGFIGEYQIFTSNLHWQSISSSNQNAISYKVEPVSFPFFPDCISSDCGTSTGNNLRVLKMPQNYTAGYGVYINTFGNQYNTSGSNIDMSAEMELYSNIFTRTNPVSGQRDMLPHTILKHTIYFHCGSSIFDPVIDSFSFVLDHTRGMMCKYPFRSDNGASNYLEHDITVNPFFYTYDNTSFINTPIQSSNILNTTNYYPYPDPSFPSTSCLGILSPTSNDIYDPSTSFVHPSPYSILSAILGDAEEMLFAGYDNNTLTPLPGIEHHYVIDRAIDLRTINKVERVIYNPSDVDITTPFPIPLVFPSGYSFRTVGATYATQTEVVTLDPYNLYGDYRKVPVYGNALHLSDNPNTVRDDKMSIYRIKSGAKLVIEPCVAIYDAQIIVEPGGALEYTPSRTSGNYTIVQQSGSTVITHSDPGGIACVSSCYDPSNYNVYDLTINGSQTWTTSNLSGSIAPQAGFQTITGGRLNVAHNLIIKAGATLTIDAGVQLAFGPIGRIYIEPTAKLIVNGTSANPVTFGPACQLEWGGIIVRGDATQSQLPFATTPQGYLELNYAIISHARDAVSLGWNGVANSEGGIVRANNTQFLNNVRDVQFLAYRNYSPNNINLTTDNLSWFKSCTFKTDEYMYDPSLWVNNGNTPTANIAHVTMNFVRGVRFESCVFKTETPTNYQPHLRGIGIFAIDAGLNIKPATACVFENMSTGIWMQSTGFSAGIVRIDGQTFTGNIHSIVLEGTDASLIFANKIDVPLSPHFGYSTTSLERGYDKPVGLYLIGSTDFRVEENQFNVGDNTTLPTPDPTCSDCAYDIVVNNSVRTDPNSQNETGTGLIYRNQLLHADLGIQAEGNNGGLNPNSQQFGLDARCNTFSDLNVFDYGSIGRNSGPSSVYSTLRDQGDCGSSALMAANTFDPNCQNYENLIWTNNSQNFINHDKAITQPSCTNASIVLCPVNMSGNTCPMNYRAAIPIHSLVVQLNSLQVDVAVARTTLDSLIDGGNTSALSEQLTTGTPAANLQALTQYSPWLSDAILLQAIAMRSSLGEKELTDVLVLNGALSTAVYTAVLQAEPAFSTENLGRIVTAQQAPSARSKKEHEISALRFELDANCNQFYAEALQKDSFSAAITYFDTTGGIANLRRLAKLYWYSGNTTGVQTTLARIYTAQNNEAGNFYQLMQAAIAQQQAGRSWTTATPAELLLADSIYTSNPEFEVQARTIVGMYRKLRYARDPYPLVGNSNRFSQANTTNQARSSQALSIYPNPSTGAFTVETSTATTTSPEVFDLLGNRITVGVEQVDDTHWLFSAEQLAPGIYLMRSKQRDGTISTSRFILTR